MASTLDSLGKCDLRRQRSLAAGRTLDDAEDVPDADMLLLVNNARSSDDAGFESGKVHKQELRVAENAVFAMDMAQAGITVDGTALQEALAGRNRERQRKEEELQDFRSAREGGHRPIRGATAESGAAAAIEKRKLPSFLKLRTVTERKSSGEATAESLEKKLRTVDVEGAGQASPVAVPAECITDTKIEAAKQLKAAPGGGIGGLGGYASDDSSFEDAESDE